MQKAGFLMTLKYFTPPSEKTCGSHQVTHKPACAATKTTGRSSLEILDIEHIEIILSKQRKNKHANLRFFIYKKCLLLLPIHGPESSKNVIGPAGHGHGGKKQFPGVVDKNNNTIYKVDAGIGWSWFRLGLALWLVYRLARKPSTVVDEVSPFGNLFHSRIVLGKTSCLVCSW